MEVISQLKGDENVKEYFKNVVKILDANKNIGSQRSIDMLKDLSQGLNDDYFIDNVEENYSTFWPEHDSQCPSLTKLFEILRKHLLNEPQGDGEESKAIIFVQERKTAKWLANIILKEEEFSKLEPRYFFFFFFFFFLLRIINL